MYTPGFFRYHRNMNNWAALFDWDGVIVDSAAEHERSWELLAGEEGLYLPEDHFLRGFGMRNEVIIPELLEWTQEPDAIHRLSRRKEELYRALIRENGVTILPGVRSYLDRLRSLGVRSCVASSTHRANIETIIEVAGLQGYFTGMVTSEDVSRGKPDPEVFLKAAAVLGQSPSDCVVFEDAHHGVEAGKAAGMFVVGVLTTHPGGVLKGADRLVNRLDELPGDPRTTV